MVIITSDAINIIQNTVEAGKKPKGMGYIYFF